MEVIANRHRRDLEFNVGHRVWLSTKHLPLKVTSRKLAALWTGPFMVTERIGSVAYKLDIPDHWNIHNVFHVSQIKLCIGDVQQEQPIDVDGSEEFEISRILGHRVARGQYQYLCGWKGYDDYENSWVPAANMGNAKELVRMYEKSLSSSRQQKTRGGSGVRP